jgi:hypothetical protein
VRGQAMDWRDLTLRIVGGDAYGALSWLPADIQSALGDPVRASVACGFGAVLAAAVITATLSSFASWRLLQSPKARS